MKDGGASGADESGNVFDQRPHRRHSRGGWVGATRMTALSRAGGRDRREILRVGPAVPAASAETWQNPLAGIAGPTEGAIAGGGAVNPGLALGPAGWHAGP